MLRRPTRTLLVAVSLTALSACGGSGGSGGAAAPKVDGPVAAAIQPGATLLGEVGTKDSPDAYDIALRDQAGANVTTLPAGAYTIVVQDYSSIHNWVLSGTGVDVATDVAKRGEMTFQVTLVAGSYTFVCDPHPSMRGTVTVT